MNHKEFYRYSFSVLRCLWASLCVVLERVWIDLVNYLFYLAIALL